MRGHVGEGEDPARPSLACNVDVDVEQRRRQPEGITSAVTVGGVVGMDGTRSKDTSSASPTPARISPGLNQVLKEIRDKYNLKSVAEASEVLVDELLATLSEAEDFLHPAVHESQKLSRELQDRNLHDFARLQNQFTALFRRGLKATERRPDAVEFVHQAYTLGIQYVGGEIDHLPELEDPHHGND